MKFSAEILTKCKQIAVLKTGPKVVTTVIESPDGKRFVSKKFHPEYASEARTEYLFLQAVKGENIIRALDFVASESPVIIMEYVEGKPLSQDSFKNKKEQEQCFARLAQTLAVIHNYGICSNDIKPENILVENNKAFLIDFGLATVNLFFERKFRGTPAFAAPEKHLHQTNHFAADVFSLGMTMFFVKNGRTILDITGEQEYRKLISREELWQKQIEILESDSLIQSMLSYNPGKRPQAIEAALALAARNKLKLESADKTIIDSHVFKVQMAGVEKLWKRKSLCCDYTDEPKIIENLLSLWAESEGRKLLILDEGFFISQPEEFFHSFPFGYREKNIYQPHFIEWLEEQPLAILLRRNKELNPTSFFDEIQKRTTAMQLWMGTESDVKPVGIQEIQDLLLQIPQLDIEKNNLRKLIKSAKPFYVRLLLLGFLSPEKPLLAQNELSQFLAWIKISLPLALVEKIWENWHILVQDGLLNRKIIFESNAIRCDAKNDCSEQPSREVMQKVTDYALKSGFHNIAGEIYHLTGDSEKALDSWTGYVDDLIKKEYFLSAYEFIGQLKKRSKTLSFELQKKEAFLARICGHFELSNRMYEVLIAESEGLLKAVLSVDRAIVLQALKRYEEAIDSYKNAIELFRIHKDQKSLFRAMNNLGVVYFGLQRYTDAEQIFNDVLNEARRQDNIQFEAISYLNLSDVQLKRCEWKRA
ncbi:MAG: tetratricopeptide repeat-containing protein kinase family protein, partial [Candidatus Cloacimonadaceae bacterium]